MDSQLENMLIRYVLEHSDYDILPISGIEIAALWSTRDKYAWDLFGKCIQLQGVDRQLSILNSQYFDEQVLRRYNDKRSGSDPKLEPLTIGCKKNKMLKDGITRFNLIMAGKSGGFPYFYASGTGTNDVSFSNFSLHKENQRVDIRTDGILDAEGSTLFQRARFPTGIPDADISEFGACDAEEDPSIFFWRSVLDSEEILKHVQGETWYNGSHYMVVYSK